jgi:MFS family permease
MSVEMSVEVEKRVVIGGGVADTPVVRGRRFAFLAAALSFVAVFMAGATPIPLYDLYRAQNGVTNAELSVAAVGYFVLAVTGLLILGRLSDHVGRRPVAIAALVVALLGSVVFVTVDGPAPLIAGRALQGLAAGLASSAIGAFAVDAAPARPRWLIGTVTSAASTVGLAVGAFGSGALVELAPLPRLLVFVIAGALLLLCIVGIALAPETVRPAAGAWRSLRPRFDLPPAARRFVPAAAAVSVATWAFGGYYQSFGPSVAADDLGSGSALVAAAVFASYMAPSVFGGPIAGRLRPAASQRAGMALVVAAAAGLLFAIAAGSAAFFISAGVIGGFGMGLSTAGSMRALLPEAAPHQRAGLLALVYGASYLGAAVPSLVAGQLSRTVDLFAITCGYAVLAALALVVVLMTARNPVTEKGGRR